MNENDERRPDDESEPVAMDRAQEIVAVQDQDALTTAGKVPAATDYNTQRMRPMSETTAKVVFGAAALGLLLIIVAFFWDAFEDAAEKGGQVIRSSGMFRRQVMLSVDSEPDRARVIVDGQERGQTRALLSVECDGGEDMVVKVLKEGYQPQEKKVPCNDTVIKVKLDLVAR